MQDRPNVPAKKPVKSVRKPRKFKGPIKLLSDEGFPQEMRDKVSGLSADERNGLVEKLLNYVLTIITNQPSYEPDKN